MARQQLLWSDLHQLDVAELAEVRPPDCAGRLYRRGGSAPASTAPAQDGPARLLPGADAQRLEREPLALGALHHLRKRAGEGDHRPDHARRGGAGGRVRADRRPRPGALARGAAPRHAATQPTPPTTPPACRTPFAPWSQDHEAETWTLCGRKPSLTRPDIPSRATRVHTLFACHAPLSEEHVSARASAVPPQARGSPRPAPSRPNREREPVEWPPCVGLCGT